MKANHNEAFFLGQAGLLFPMV
ncbi:hypothetical protein HMPREF1072_00001, partial [Bacteroides uniformis CL03T00C23]